MTFRAEDLGFLTPSVARLLKDSGYPGMKVLEIAFDSRDPDRTDAAALQSETASAVH